MGLAVVALIAIGVGATAVVLVNGGGTKVTEHLSSPQTIGQFQLSTDPSGSLTQPSMTNDVRDEVLNPTGSIANLYVENADISKPVVVVAVTGTVNDPDSKMTALFQEEGTDQITNVHDVDAGNLSGTAKCGSATEEDLTLNVCVWVDPGSLGAVVCLGRSSAEAETIFRQMRNAVLTRD
jgi:hypothetical protein